MQFNDVAAAPRFRVSVCTQERTNASPRCSSHGGLAVAIALREELEKQGIADEVVVSTIGCQGLCKCGPVMIVEPGATWYGRMCPEEVPEIVLSHLKNGVPVKRAWVITSQP